MKSNYKFQLLQFGAAVLLCALFVFSASGNAQAVELVSGSSLPAGETVDDDVVISGENVVIDGNVNGNLIAFGNTVTVNGEVNGDIIAFGSWVIVNGKVSGNVFSMAQTIEVNGEVAGSLFGGSASLELGPEAKLGSNVYSGSYSLEAQKGSTIEKDLAAGAYQVFLDGAIGRDARVGAAALELNGSVGRDLIASVEAPGARSFMPFQFFPKQPNAPVMPEPADPGLRIGPEASIGGELIYTSPASQEAAIQAAPAGGVVYQTPVPKETTEPAPAAKPKPAGFGLLGWLFKLVREIIALMVFGSLAIWLVYPHFKRAADQIGLKPLPSMGVGFVALVVGYAGFFAAAGLLLAIVILFAIVTLGGISGTLFGVGFSALALAFALFSFLVAFGSKLVFALFVGQKLLRNASPESKGARYGALALGVLIYALAHSIPFVGWLVAFFVTLFGLGAMWYAYQAGRMKGEVEAVPAPAE